MDAAAEPENVDVCAAFGAAVRRCRLTAGLTQEALAETAGLGVRTIQGLEQGENRPRLETIRRLGVALGLSQREVTNFTGAARQLPTARRQRLDVVSGWSHKAPEAETLARGVPVAPESDCLVEPRGQGIAPSDLRARRRALQLTQEALALALRVSVNTLSRWERGVLGMRDPAGIAQVLQQLQSARDANRVASFGIVSNLAAHHVDSQSHLRSAMKRPTTASKQSNGHATSQDSDPTDQTSLPARLTSFIGRECAIADLSHALRHSRLVTLTGPGGIGKTRLALRLADSTHREYPDGVWFVDFADAASGASVTQMVASVLRVREQSARSPEVVLAEAVANRRMLLVLDNCEHLVDVCARLSYALLQGCRELRVLATSREPLNIEGEVVWRVPPLSLPALAPTSSVEQAAAFESVRLFIDRAQAVWPEFRLSDDNVASVIDVCRKLDGIPLAIELAAGRLSALSPSEIASRLSGRFELLRAGTRSALPRQQTLRATLDWSYDSLSEKDKRLLRGLSVFAGGWALEAAEAVCSQDCLSGLLGLVEKSLVMVDEHAKVTRYCLLQTIREYAHEKLETAGEVDGYAEQHLTYYVNLAEHARHKLAGSEQVQWLGRLERERENVQAALQRALDTHASKRALQLVTAVWRLWAHGHLAESRLLLEQVLDQTSDAPVALRAEALLAAGTLAYEQGDYDAAGVHFQASLEAHRDLGDDRGVAAALNQLAGLARARNDHELAIALYEHHLRVQQELGDKLGIAHALDELGHVAQVRGEYNRAIELHTQGLALFRELEDLSGAAYALNSLGVSARARGDYQQAAATLAESLALFEELGDKRGIACTYDCLGVLARYQGANERAAKLHQDSLAMYREMGNQRGMAYALDSLGNVARAREDWQQAEKLHKQALQLYESFQDTRGTAYALGGLGATTIRRGDLGLAQTLLNRSLALHRQAGNRAGFASVLTQLADVAVAQHKTDHASALYDESLIINRELGNLRGTARAIAGQARLALARGDREQSSKLHRRSQMLRRDTRAPRRSGAGGTNGG
jgi:non-specific serine/threonine protein kinase